MRVQRFDGFDFLIYNAPAQPDEWCAENGQEAASPQRTCNIENLPPVRGPTLLSLPPLFYLSERGQSFREPMCRRFNNVAR
jgi:hypothetical protein